MNAAEVLAALCNKAKDVAVASRISEASTRFSLLNRGQIVNEAGTVIATLCKKAASFNVPNTSPTTRLCRSSSESRLEGSRALESDELTELTKSRAKTSPNWVETQDPLPHDATARRNSLSELSTVSLTSDFDALSVQATAGSFLQDSAGNLSVDSLVEAICSDARLLETLNNASSLQSAKCT